MKKLTLIISLIITLLEQIYAKDAPNVLLLCIDDLRPELAAFDAELKFEVQDLFTQESPLCIAGEILQGLKKTVECPAFCKECTPQTPLGAPMVSSEGACAAYYRYHR